MIQVKVCLCVDLGKPGIVVGWEGRRKQGYILPFGTDQKASFPKKNGEKMGLELMLQTVGLSGS